MAWLAAAITALSLPWLASLLLALQWPGDNTCPMTYSQPGFSRVWMNGSVGVDSAVWPTGAVQRQLGHRWALLRYSCPRQAASQPARTTPVLCMVGHMGHFGQCRSLAQLACSRATLVVYLLAHPPLPLAAAPPLLAAQAQAGQAAVRAVQALHATEQGALAPPVVLVGHSMGGVAAAMVAGEVGPHVRGVVALAAPLSAPPLLPSLRGLLLYGQLQRRLGRGGDPPLLQVQGGAWDWHVPWGGLTEAAPPPSSSPRGPPAVTWWAPFLPHPDGTCTPTDHLSVMWCRPILHRVLEVVQSGSAAGAWHNSATTAAAQRLPPMPDPRRQRQLAAERAAFARVWSWAGAVVGGLAAPWHMRSGANCTSPQVSWWGTLGAAGATSALPLVHCIWAAGVLWGLHDPRLAAAGLALAGPAAAFAWGNHAPEPLALMAAGWAAGSAATWAVQSASVGGAVWMAVVYCCAPGVSTLATLAIVWTMAVFSACLHAASLVVPEIHAPRLRLGVAALLLCAPTALEQALLVAYPAPEGWW